MHMMIMLFLLPVGYYQLWLRLPIYVYQCVFFINILVYWCLSMVPCHITITFGCNVCLRLYAYMYMYFLHACSICSNYSFVFICTHYDLSEISPACVCVCIFTSSSKT